MFSFLFKELLEVFFSYGHLEPVFLLLSSNLLPDLLSCCQDFFFALLINSFRLKKSFSLKHFCLFDKFFSFFGVWFLGSEQIQIDFFLNDPFLLTVTNLEVHSNNSTRSSSFVKLISKAKESKVQTLIEKRKLQLPMVF